MTRFLFYMHNLFELEILITKSLASSTEEVLELEDDVERGFSYWERMKDEGGDAKQNETNLYSALGHASPAT